MCITAGVLPKSLEWWHAAWARLGEKEVTSMSARRSSGFGEPLDNIPLATLLRDRRLLRAELLELQEADATTTETDEVAREIERYSRVIRQIQEAQTQTNPPTERPAVLEPEIRILTDNTD